MRDRRNRRGIFACLRIGGCGRELGAAEGPEIRPFVRRLRQHQNRKRLDDIRHDLLQRHAG